MMNQSLQLRKIRDFGERIGDTIQFIKMNWIKLLGLYAVYVIPFLLAGIILGANSIGDFLARFSGGLSSLNGLLGIKMIMALLMFLFAASSYAAVVYLYMDHYEKTNGIAPSISDIGRKYITSFLYNVAYSFLLFAMVIFGAAILSIGFVIVKNSPFLIIAIIPLLFFFGFVAMVFILMLFPVNVIGKGTFGSAIPGTFRLLKGRWWFSIGFILILFIIYYFFSMAISTMLNLVFGFTSINMMDPEKLVGAGKTYAYVFGLTTLVQQVFYLVIFVGCGVHYFSLQEEKLGAGLEQKIDSIGTGEKREAGSEEY